MCFLIKIDAQIPCDYVPLELENLQPIWSYLVIDSTIIGYDDTSAVHWNFYVDGMNHLSRESFTLLNNDYLCSFTEIYFDLDLAGYLIDKINLESGEKIWQIVSDPRTSINDEKLLNAYIKSNKLIVEGVREQEKSEVIFGLARGGTNTLYFTKQTYEIK